jgi:bla regulator protein BlaR1
MNTSFWTPYISDGAVKAICWTLIHSLWIGMICAVITGMVITFTRKSSADTRYRLLCGILLLFVVSIAITYGIEAKSSSGAPATVAGQKFINSGAPADYNEHYNIGSPRTNLVNSAVGFLDQNARIIFLVWLMFFVLKSLKLVSGLLYIQRIRNYKIHNVAEEFKHKIALFSSQIGIRQTVRLVQSELVKVPVAIGWLKPVILLPMGIILQLPAEQLDCILWHELAHIRRRDYLVNIVQGLVETVFFFNPGLLWLSSLIRSEREACCDDMVLSRMNRKANYMEALLAFGYGDFKSIGLAMGIGSGSQLRDRLRRMVSEENKRLSIAEKAVLGIGLIVLSAFTTIPKAGRAAGTFAGTVSKTISAIMKAPAVVRPGGVKRPAAEKRPPVKPVQIAERQVVETADTVIHFNSVLFKNSDADLANNDVSAMDDQGNVYHFILVNNNITAMQVNGVSVADDKLSGFAYMIRYIDREIASKRHVMEGDIVAYKLKSPAAKFKKKDSLGYSKRKYFADIDAKRAKMDQRMNVRRKYEMDAEPGAKYFKSEAGLKRKQQDDANYDAQLSRVDGVIADLVKEKVVADATAVKWFGLSDSELIVNGAKQPDALHQKLKAAFGIRENYGLYYGPVEMTGTGVFIDNDAKYRNMDRDNPMRFKSDGQRMKFKQDKLNFQEQKMKMRDGHPGEKKFLLPRAGLGPVVSDVINDLVKAHILNDRNDLVSFDLTNTVLMVNGVKQPEEIQKRLSAKYLKNLPDDGHPSNQNDPNFGLHYNVKTGSRGMGISTDKNDQ